VILLPNATGTVPVTVTFAAYAISSGSLVSYNWFYGDYYGAQTTSVSIVTGSMATYTYLNVANYTAAVQVHDSSGCFAQSQVAINVLSGAIPEFDTSIFAAFAVGLVLVLTFANKFKRKPHLG
jgi:disulfide bond formation protein DsbB